MPEQRPAEIAPAEIPGLHGLLFVAVTVVVVAGLYFGRTVLIPITIAMLLSFLLAPLVSLLRRLWLGRVLSVLLAMLLALMVILALGGLIGTQLATLAEDVPTYAVAIQGKIDTLRQIVVSHMAGLTAGLTPRTEPASTVAKPRAAGVPAKPSAEAPKAMQVEVRQPDMTAIELARRIVTPVVEPLSTTAIVLVVLVFILLQREDLRDRMIRLFGSSDLHRTTVAMNDAARRLSRYLLIQVAVNTAFGAIIAAGLALIGVPSAVMWGVLGTLLRFVPYVGAPLSALAPLTLAAAIDPGWSLLLWTAALYFVVEATIGQMVEPLLYGHSTGLSPFAVVVAATFWTWLWGPIGLVLSTPLTLCVVVLGRHVARLRFLEVLLGDQPALTHVESFYQRMLAGDADAAHDQAETLLKGLSLASYYDQVAVNGLRLAAVDAARGVLTQAHLSRFRASIQSLIEDLEDHEESQPPAEAAAVPSLLGAEHELSVDAAALPVSPDLALAGSNPALVLCVAGRGPLDEEATAMLAQLLRKQGLASRVVPHSATARTAIGTINLSGVTIACMSGLELSGNPSSLKYSMRRLRALLPRTVPVLVGLWPHGDEVMFDERLRAAVGADYYATSLDEALRTCLEIWAAADEVPEGAAAAE